MEGVWREQDRAITRILFMLERWLVLCFGLLSMQNCQWRYLSPVSFLFFIGSYSVHV